MKRNDKSILAATGLLNEPSEDTVNSYGYDDLRATQEDSTSTPTLVIVGSLKGPSYKDVLSYAKGLAISQCSAMNCIKICVLKDLINDRWIYEIHEGGEGYSFIDPILKDKNRSNVRVSVRLSDNRVADINDVDGDVFTLISEVDDSKSEDKNETGIQLKPMLPDGRLFLKGSIITLISCIAIFTISLLSYVGFGAALKEGLIYPFVSHNESSDTALQSYALLDTLYKSKKELSEIKLVDQTSYIKSITYSDGKWNKEISKQLMNID